MTEPNEAVNPEIEPEDEPDVIAHEDESGEGEEFPKDGWCGVHQSQN
ncbi:hypothetical protein GCM10009677_02000 [Sphaerisporangium rubeum]|uniref:Uncharacterized protein n=1 Tax=Sphaerisporangium rubeum TaxID=321317 RepID=A0A7X0M7S9_9ACTN|nr:hypothetical protein [Sphaerisporangium rubeum]MBB6473151.1 hypothetical protein [Sphaerisporangium rubeum]